jgi:hypothetical protein
MTWYELWLFLHIAAAMVWIGGATVAQIFGFLAQRSGDPAQNAAFGQAMGFIGPKIFVPASIAVLLSGILLTEDGEWDWGEWFIVLGLLGWVAVSLVGFAYLNRAMGALGAPNGGRGAEPGTRRQSPPLGAARTRAAPHPLRDRLRDGRKTRDVVPAVPPETQTSPAAGDGFVTYDEFSAPDLDPAR